MQHYNYFCNKSCKIEKIISSLPLIRNKMRCLRLGVGVQRKIWHLSCETSNGAPAKEDRKIVIIRNMDFSYCFNVNTVSLPIQRRRSIKT